MGGPVPLGYDDRDRKLVINDTEADTVRHIYRRYLELGWVRELIAALAHEGARTKVQVRTSTANCGGVPFARGTLFHLLKNRIYRSEIVHKGTSYSGDHQPIVPVDLWDQVEQRLADRTRARVLGNGADHPSLLAGLIRDGEGRPMSLSHANKGPKRYRYNVTHASHVSREQPAWRVAAHDLEAMVVNRMIEHLGDPTASVCPSDTHRDRASSRITQVARDRNQLATGTPSERRQVLLDHGATIVLHEDHVAVTLKADDAGSGSLAGGSTILTVAAVRVRRGHDIRLVVAAPPSAIPHRDARPVQLVADAFATRDRMEAMGDVTIAKAAAWFACCRSTLTDRIKLSYLAPDIIEAILAGRQPRALTRRRLAAVDLPIDWRQQRAMLGFV